MAWVCICTLQDTFLLALLSALTQWTNMIAKSPILPIRKLRHTEIRNQIYGLKKGLAVDSTLSCLGTAKDLRLS